MRTIRIFLASSSELKHDREQFEIAINRKNKEWIEQGIFLELVIWEDFTDNMSQTRLQDEYNEALRRCDLFVMLFRSKVGKYTREEFEMAFGQFRATSKPFIFTYFSEARTDVLPDPSVTEFKQLLNDLGHFYTTYRSAEELNLKFTQQLEKLRNNGFIRFPVLKQVRLSNIIKYLLLFLVLPATLLFLIYKGTIGSRPFDCTVRITDAGRNKNLPYTGGELTLIYGDKSETHQVDNETIFKKIPAEFMGEPVRIRFTAKGYRTLDSTFLLHDHLDLTIQRDNALATLFGSVKDEVSQQPVAGAEVMVKNIRTTTDAGGQFSISLPEALQDTEQRITVYKEGYQSSTITTAVVEGVEAIILLKK